jgi:hypothetical protein
VAQAPFTSRELGEFWDQSLRPCEIFDIVNPRINGDIFEMFTVDEDSVVAFQTGIVNLQVEDLQILHWGLYHCDQTNMERDLICLKR